MKFGANKILGLAIGERSILIAQLSINDGQREVTRAGELVYADGIGLADPTALGVALGAYLKREGFDAKWAVFGIPAKWVLTKSKEVPPVDPSLAADLLRLQVESEFSAELKDLVYDYAGQTDANHSSHVLLAATPQRHVEQIGAIADAARLDVQGIAPTSVVLSAVTGGVMDALVLSITPSGTELAAQRGSNPSLLRHVGASMTVTPAVAGEVRRASLMMPRTGAGGNGATNGHSHGQVVVWDDAGLDAASRKAVTEALGPSARSGELSALGVGRVASDIPAHAVAVSLAAAGASDTGLPIDFLNSRLAAPKKSAIPRQTVLAIAAGIAILVGIIYAYVDLNHKQAERDDLVARIEGNKQPLEKAKSDVARMRFAEGWHAGKPRYLACLADLTNAVPVNGKPAVFLVSMTLDDSMKGEIRGRATTKDAAEAFFKKLNQSPRFTNVNSDRDKGNNNPETKAEFPISFTITFTYQPAARG